MSNNQSYCHNCENLKNIIIQKDDIISDLATDITRYQQLFLLDGKHFELVKPLFKQYETIDQKISILGDEIKNGSKDGLNDKQLKLKSYKIALQHLLLQHVLNEIAAIITSYNDEKRKKNQ